MFGCKHVLKHIYNYISVILLITAIQLTLLLLAAMIPRSALQKHFEESADYLTEREVFFYINPKDSAGKIDRYADSILLGIAYSYDCGHPLQSVMRSSYYHTDMLNENINLKNAVYNHLEPNSEYIRYWHGSNIIVRPLLSVFNIREIYILNAVVLVILLFLLLRSVKIHIGAYAAVCLSIAFCMTSLWYVPYSLETTWMIFLMCISSIAALDMYGKTKRPLGFFFLAVGSFTAYFDFLTTETLTLTVPLSLILVKGYTDKTICDFKDGLLFSVRQSIYWFIGYASAWIMKWSLASIILKENAFLSALRQASYRISGETEALTGYNRLFAAEVRNLSCLFPFSLMKKNAFALVCLTLTILFCIYYLIKKTTDCDLSNLLFLLALIPYIRFFVLSNHSCLHYFFTFRAQLASIFCIILGIVCGADKKLLNKEWRKLCRKTKS